MWKLGILDQSQEEVARPWDSSGERLGGTYLLANLIPEIQGRSGGSDCPKAMNPGAIIYASFIVTILALQQIFSRFGKVDKIVMFDKGSGFQALVQMSDVYTAMTAHEAADMQEMYSGCNLIRVGYSNLHNVTVKSNTERSWDFNIGPPLDGALPPGKSPSPNPKSGVSADVVGNDYRYTADVNPVTPVAPPSPASLTPPRHSPQQSYSTQQYSPYSAVQHQHQHQPQPQQQSSPYVTPVPQPQQQQQHQSQDHQQQQNHDQQPYISQLQQQHAYGAPPSPPHSAYPAPPHQQTYSDGVGHYGPPPPPGVGVPGGGSSYAPKPYGQQGYVGHAYSQPPFNTPPYGHNYPPRGPQRGVGDDSGGNTGGAAARIGGPGGYPRPPPQSSGSYYQPSPGLMPPHGGPYGSIPFSERGSNGFGSIGLGAGRPMPHSSGPVMGTVGGTGAGTLGIGGPGGRGGGGGRGPGYGPRGGGRGLYGAGSGGGSGALLQTPMHRSIPAVAYDNGAFRPQTRFRSSDKKSGGVASAGESKPGSRVPRLDPLHIQALSAPAAKKAARSRSLEKVVVDDTGNKASASVVTDETAAKAVASSGAAAVAAEMQRTVNGGGCKVAVALSAEELSPAAPAAGSSSGAADGGPVDGAGVGAGEAGGKKANKREAAEMLGPDTTDQLAAATAKVRVSDMTEEDGEGKRAFKREAAEMLGPDAADQLAAATARVRVSDDGENGEDSAGPKAGEASAASGAEMTNLVEQGGRKEVKRKEREAASPAGVGTKDGGSDGINGCGNKTANLGTNGNSVEGIVGSGVSAVEEPGSKKGRGASASEVGQGVVGEKALEKPDSAVQVEETAEDEGSGQKKACGDTSESVAVKEEKVAATETKADRERGVSSKAALESDSIREGMGGKTTDVPLKAQFESVLPDNDAKLKGGVVVPDVKEVKKDMSSDGTGNEAKGENADNDDGDVVSPGGVKETVDVSAWVSAAPASRSPILMVRQVDAREVTSGTLCQLFGIYGDVMKVKLVTARGMALVQMRYAVQAMNAQRLLDQTTLCGMALEVRASSQWTINDPTATNYSEYEGVHRYKAATSPEDPRYRSSLSPPCPTLVVDNLSLDMSVEELTDIFAKHGAVSSVDLNTHAKASLASSSTTGPDATAGYELKPSAQALVQMGADGRIGATEAAVHALVMTHNLTLHGRRLRVSFLNSERHL